MYFLASKNNISFEKRSNVCSIGTKNKFPKTKNQIVKRSYSNLVEIKLCCNFKVCYKNFRLSYEQLFTKYGFHLSLCKSVFLALLSAIFKLTFVWFNPDFIYNTWWQLVYIKVLNLHFQAIDAVNQWNCSLSIQDRVII